MLSAFPAFVLPDRAIASRPPEKCGLSRDQVRLMVIERSGERIYHSRFVRIGDFLQPGDLLIFNNSRTLPAVLHARDSQQKTFVEIRLAERLDDDSWYALLLSPYAQTGELEMQNGIRINVLSPHPTIDRLWKIRFSLPHSELLNELYRNGEPVRYEYTDHPWALNYYQTVYALQPGSAEMPSAGRAFTWELLFALKRQQIEFASITLHATISSYMDDVVDSKHPVSEEEYSIREAAAEKINRAKSENRKIIAVGTTVVRALESAASKGRIKPGRNYTRLRIDSSHSLQIASGLLTGFHEPRASHLDLLTAFLPAAMIQHAYEQAISSGYLWHEFGDLNLIL